MLLMHGDPDEIVARLRSDYAAAFDTHKHLLPIETPEKNRPGVPACLL